MRTISWHKLAIVIPGICAGFLILVLFPVQASADEVCLRGGDGNCVELTRQSPTGTGVDAKDLMGQSVSSNFFALQDGSFVAFVAKYSASFGFNGVTNLNRYEIFLYYSRDGGVTWEQSPVSNKGYWYVDEHLPGSVSSSFGGGPPVAMDVGAGYLGFDISTVYDQTTKKTNIVLAHTIACDRSGSNDTNVNSITDFDEFDSSTCSNFNLNFAEGSVYVDTIVYDHTDRSFKEVGKTRSVTRTKGMPYGSGDSCTTGVCYGGGYGADHPSVAVAMVSNQLKMWVSYSAHRGGNCPQGSAAAYSEGYYWPYCKDQNLLDWNLPNINGYYDNNCGTDPCGCYEPDPVGGVCPGNDPVDDSMGVGNVKQLWVKRLNINTDTGALSAVTTATPTADNVSLERLPRGTDGWGSGQSPNDSNYFASKIAVLRNNYPILVYSYSRSGASVVQPMLPYADLYPLNYRYWNGTGWTSAQKVQGASPSAMIKNNYSQIQNIVGAVTLASGEKISTLAGVTSPVYSYWSNYSRIGTVFHVAAYGALADGSYVPVYIRFYMDNDGLISNAPEALALVGQDTAGNTLNTLGIDGNSATNGLLKVNPNKGGPSIGWGRTFVYVGVPATSAGDAATIPVYTRVQPESVTVGVVTRDWSTTIASSWLVDSPPDDPNKTIYSQPINSSPASNEGFAQPKIVDYPPQTIYVGGTPSPETATNVFSLEMLFGRSQNNTQSCNAGNWCSAGYSGEYNTSGIRGWAWAESVGWISLSCKNLETCYSKSYDAAGNAWSTKEGGLYYGVRAVTNGAFPSRTLVGNAWSERIGYLSFDRATGAYAGNQCGNPPSGYGLTFATTNSECAYLKVALSGDASDTNVQLVDGSGNAVTIKTGSFIVDSEVMNFNGTTYRRGPNLANVIFKSIATAHAAGTPVFWINGNDVTTSANGIYDIYRGINSFDASSYELQGWARAESWAMYQREYCKNQSTGAIEIGSSFPAPCDKEWGWVKLSGTWSTVHPSAVATVPTVGTNSLKATSIDGYPDPATSGHNEQLYIPSTVANNYLWTYSSLITSGANSPGFTMTQNYTVLNRPSAGTSISWVATLTQSILADSTEISLSSTSGLLSSGKLRIRQDSNADGLINASDVASEVIEYSSVDTTTNTIEFISRGADSTTARAWGAGAFVELVSESGTYNTFVIPIGDTQPERTLAGFGWSAPNTETVTPDPTVSRYQNNISGFGWVNFQPNKLEQIYPYLRTLFGNLYVGGNIEIVGPEFNSISPKQYTSTYQIQSNGSVTLYVDEQQGASSGEFQRCFAACTDEDCVNECNASFNPSEGSGISLDEGTASTLGKIPELDSIRTMVSECQRWDNASGAYVDAPCSNGSNLQAWQLSTEADFASLASTGVNKFGQQVVICRANPSSTNVRSKQVFGFYTYNPPECRWGLSQGFTASVAVSYPANQNYICLSGISGLISDTGKITFGNDASSMNTLSYTKASDTTGCAVGTKLLLSLSTSYATDVGKAITEVEIPQFYKVNRSHTGRPTVYVLPLMYGNTGAGQFMFDDTPMQFNNAPEGESGAVTFVIPGSVFYLNNPMRYCPQGLNQLPCLASDDIPFNSSTNNNPDTIVSDTSQIASVAWLIDGSVTNLDGYNGLEFYPERKTYRVGAYVVMGNAETEEWQPLGQAGTYWSLYMLNTGMQLNVYGLVMARNYLLPGQYYVQDENEYVIEPSENFIYDGRVVVNPPPGLEDLASGLPTISQAIP